MPKLRVFFDASLTESRSAVVALDILDSKLQKVGGHTHRLQLGFPTEVSVDPGEYLVQAYLPSGEVVASQVEVAARQTIDVPLAPIEPSPRESLDWSYYLKSSSRSPAARVAASSSLVTKGKLKTEIWESEGLAKWWPRQDLTAQADEEDIGDPRSLERLRIGAFQQPLWLRVEWASGRGKFVALPQTLEVKVNILADEIPGADPDPVNVIVDGGNSQAEAILAFLVRGETDRARVAGEGFADNAEELLLHKMRDPAAAAIGGYFLLLAGRFDKLHNWTQNLDRLFERLPDGAVIHAWHRLQQETPDFKLARDRLLAAVSRGLPVYTRGLRLLYDGLSMLAHRHQQEHKGHPDQGLEGALVALRPYAAAADWQAATTTFYGVAPTQPEPLALDMNE